MSYLHRVTPNKATSQNIEAIYNEKGQMLDANTKEVLVQGRLTKVISMDMKNRLCGYVQNAVI